MKTRAHLLYLKYLLLITASFYTQRSISQEKLYNIKLDIHYEMNQPGDTIYLTFSPAYNTNLKRTEERYTAIVDRDSVARFNVLNQYPYGYISIIKTKLYTVGDVLNLAEDLFWENGDDISIYIKQPTERSKRNYIYDTIFKGKNKEKYTTIYNIRKGYKSVQVKRRKESSKSMRVYNPLDFSPYKAPEDVKLLLSILDSNRLTLKSFSYNVLKSDLLMEDNNLHVRGLNILDVEIQKNLTRSTKDSIILNLRKDYLPILRLVVDEKALSASKNMVTFYTSLFYTIGKLQPEYNEFNVVRDITDNSSGIFREALLTTFLNLAGYSSENRSLYDTVYNYLSSNYYKDIFYQIKSKSEINIGKYSLTDMEGKEISLSALKGKLTLLDFWSSGCGACITYRQNILSKIEKEFQANSGFQILSINMDKHLKIWKNLVALDTYANPNGINMYTSGLEFSHPLVHDLGIGSLPTIILVDQDLNVIDNYSIKLRYLPLLRDLINNNLN